MSLRIDSYYSCDNIGYNTETHKNNSESVSVFPPLQSSKANSVEKEVYRTSNAEYDSFEFFPNGKIKTWISAWPGDGYYVKTKCEYDESGNLLKETSYDDSTPDSNKILFVTTYNYKNGELVNKTFEDISEQTKDTYEIDKDELNFIKYAAAERRLNEHRNSK